MKGNTFIGVISKGEDVREIKHVLFAKRFFLALEKHFISKNSVPAKNKKRKNGGKHLQSVLISLFVGVVITGRFHYAHSLRESFFFLLFKKIAFFIDTFYI